MAIDPRAVGSRSTSRRSWDRTDCILYALGVGAGRADQLRELEFTTENSKGHPQRALPTMAAVLTPLGGSWDALGAFDRAMLVHGEEEIVLHREIPVSGEIETTTEITGVYDKGSGAVVVHEGTSVLSGTGDKLFTTRVSSFIRGAGGWGGDRGPVTLDNPVPEREPDVSVTEQTGREQALLYRLSGDRNRLHSDPALAARAGFERPILHGLCTFGFAGRVLLREACGGDPARFAGLGGRFRSPVTPGEPLTIAAWHVREDKTVFRVLGPDGRVVIDAGYLLRH